MTTAGIGALPGFTRTTRARRFTAAAVVALGLAVASPVVLDLFERPVSSVRVAGEFQHVTRAAIEAAIGGHLLAGFFTVDVDAVRRAVLALPWIREASVRRVWPGALHVSVVERVPMAAWNGTAVLEPDASIFEPSPETVPADLPRFTGPLGTQDVVLEQYRELDAALTGLPGGVVRELALNRRGAWRMTLANGIEIVMGHEDMADFRRYASAFAQVFGDRLADVAQIDMRYANGFTVRWRAGPGAANGGPTS